MGIYHWNNPKNRKDKRRTEENVGIAMYRLSEDEKVDQKLLGPIYNLNKKYNRNNNQDGRF